MTADREMLAGSFGSVADVYERARPGYPDDSVRWLAGHEPRDVVDLGAGTGKLTRALVARGHRVTAVEPLPEMLAVLRPGGRIALVWNARDDGEEWVAAFTDTIVGRSVFREGGIAATTASIDESGLYGPVERATFAHVQTLGRAELRALVRSRSHCAVLPTEEQQPILERADALFDAHATDGTLAMPYVTECFRAARR